MLHSLIEPWRGRPAAARNRDILGARAVFSAGQRWLLLAAFTLLVAFRLPHAWVHGRFLDEEATVFLAYAWHHSWLDALFRPFAGYWNLGATATTVIAVEMVRNGLVPLERAPYVTMILALAVQVLPAMLILTGRADWLQHRIAVIAALLVVAITPITEEVFLNVLHIQFHLMLCAGLILALEMPARRATRVGYGVLLFLAPLCGPGAIILLPLFALRTLLDRDRGRLAQTLAFAAGSLVQILLFYGSNPMRGHLLDPATLFASLFVRLIVLPALNFKKANLAGTAIYHARQAGETGWWWPGLVAAILFAILVLLALRRRDAVIWLVLSALSVAMASFGFGMVIFDPFDLFSVGAGERYQFLPLVMLGFALIALAMRPPFRGRWICALLCLVLLFNGTTRYRRPVRIFAEGPSWAEEVAAWRADHNHPLAVWPKPWAADLSDTAKPCSPIGDDPTRSNDPRYCESGWVAAFYHPPKIR